ncbi:MAG: AAA family ATPase [Dermatophilaceae bacterium]
MTDALTLVALSGLPGSGNTTVAFELARSARAVVVSVDPIEDALHRAGLEPTHETGVAAYLVAEVIARDAVTLGHSVIIDAANYVEVARQMWRDLASECGTGLSWVEVSCSDKAVHQQRLASRDRGFTSTLEPTWEDVLARNAATEPWPTDDENRIIRIDTAVSVQPQLESLLTQLPENWTS